MTISYFCISENPSMHDHPQTLVNGDPGRMVCLMVRSGMNVTPSELGQEAF